MSLFGITHLALLEMDLERNKESMLEADKKSRCFYNTLLEEKQIYYRSFCRFQRKCNIAIYKALLIWK